MGGKRFWVTRAEFPSEEETRNPFREFGSCIILLIFHLEWRSSTCRVLAARLSVLHTWLSVCCVNGSGSWQGCPMVKHLVVAFWGFDFAFG